jgi:hypothetical protein
MILSHVLSRLMKSTLNAWTSASFIFVLLSLYKNRFAPLLMDTFINRETVLEDSLLKRGKINFFVHLSL